MALGSKQNRKQLESYLKFTQGAGSNPFSGVALDRKVCTQMWEIYWSPTPPAPPPAPASEMARGEKVILAFEGGPESNWTSDQTLSRFMKKQNQEEIFDKYSLVQL